MWRRGAWWYRNCLFPYVHGKAVAGKHSSSQCNGLWIMQTGMDVNDYLSMRAIVTILVSLWLPSERSREQRVGR